MNAASPTHCSPCVGRAPAWLAAVIFAPLAAHTGATLYAWKHSPRFEFETPDWIAVGLVSIYAVAAVWAVRSRQRAIRFVLATGSVLVALGTIELLLWTVVPEDAKPRIPRPRVHKVSEAADTMPGITGTIEFSVNSLGLRGPEVVLSDVDLRILCVGGSTTECLYVTDRKSWPWLLQEKLESALGRKVFVGNSGKPGQFSLNHEYMLSHYTYAKQFEWVVVLCGINDMGRLLMNDLELRSKQVSTRTLAARPPQKRRDPNHAYYRNMLVWRRVQSALRTLRGPTLGPGEVIEDERGAGYTQDRLERQAALSVRTIDEPPSGLAAAVATYREHVRFVIESGRENGQKMVFMTQPTMYQKDMPAELDALIWCAQAIEPEGTFSAKALAQMMDAYNAALIEVCREEGVDCIDLAALVPKDTRTLYDDCHFNIAGCEKVSEILANYFREKLGASARAGE